MKFILTTILYLITITFPLGAEIDHPSKSLKAIRINEPINIDGYLSESSWKDNGVTEFVQRDPVEGRKPTQKTEVWVAYDNEAIYVAAKLYDSSPDSIIARLARRDERVASDEFEFRVDPWLDHRSGFFFRVSAAGAIRDGILFNDGSNDDSWDGVWESATSINREGWEVEIKIPYSQLRFPEKEIHTWGVNFIRQIERNNERIMYVMIPKNSSGDASWFAHLTGIENISQPRLIELLPFSAGRAEYIQTNAGNPFNDGSRFFNQLGLDLKLGLSSGLTLDATFNPDFGQVEVDPEVVNLSDFETFFPEKRPFFIEGSNIFRFGGGGVENYLSFNYGDPLFFYTRRIGRFPQGETNDDYENVSIPSGSTILGAGKISGKVTPEWSIGLINALTAREYADVDFNGSRFREEVEPLTNYTVIRTQREFNGGRHGLGLIGTNTYRDMGNSILENSLTGSAFMSGVDGWLTLDSDRKYVVTGWLARSRINGTEEVITAVQRSSPHYYQRPDADYVSVDSTATSMTGSAGRIYINKQKGSVIFNSGFAMISPGFEINDAGFQSNADQINWHIATGYNDVDPGKYLRSKFFSIATFRNWDFGGNKYAEGYFLFSGGELLNYWNMEFNYSYFPQFSNNNLSRGGPFIKGPIGRLAEIIIRSDERKELSYSLGVQQGKATRWFWNYSFDMTWKPNSQFNLSLNPVYTWDVTEAFYVGEEEDLTALNTFGKRYLFAETDNRSFSLGTRLNWTFTPKLSLQLFVQPLIFAIKYKDYKELANPGEFEFNIYGKDDNSTIVQSDDGEIFTISPDISRNAESFEIDNQDFNFKSLIGNAVLRWEYLPGSVFFLAWTQNRSDFDDGNGFFDFRENTRRLFDTKPDNIILAKFTYWWNP